MMTIQEEKKWNWVWRVFLICIFTEDLMSGPEN